MQSVHVSAFGHKIITTIVMEIQMLWLLSQRFCAFKMTPSEPEAR